MSARVQFEEAFYSPEVCTCLSLIKESLCRGYDVVETLEDHSASVTTVKFACNGSKLLSCSADKYVVEGSSILNHTLLLNLASYIYPSVNSKSYPSVNSLRIF